MVTMDDTEGLTQGRSKKHRYPLRAKPMNSILHVYVMISLYVVAGCRSPSPTLFAPLNPPIQWPPQPLPARIHFVGQLTSSDDLTPKRSLLETIGDVLAGRKATELLYGPRAALSLPDEQRLWIVDPGGRCLHLFDMKHHQYRKVTHVGKDPWLSPVGICAGPAGSMFVCDSEYGEI